MYILWAPNIATKYSPVHLATAFRMTQFFLLYTRPLGQAEHADTHWIIENRRSDLSLGIVAGRLKQKGERRCD